MSFFFNNKNIEKNVDLDTIKSQSVQIIMNIDTSVFPSSKSKNR